MGEGADSQARYVGMLYVSWFLIPYVKYSCHENEKNDHIIDYSREKLIQVQVQNYELCL